MNCRAWWAQPGGTPRGGRPASSRDSAPRVRQPRAYSMRPRAAGACSGRSPHQPPHPACVAGQLPRKWPTMLGRGRRTCGTASRRRPMIGGCLQIGHVNLLPGPAEQGGQVVQALAVAQADRLPGEDDGPVVALQTEHVAFLHVGRRGVKLPGTSVPGRVARRRTRAGRSGSRQRAARRERQRRPTEASKMSLRPAGGAGLARNPCEVELGQAIDAA